MKIDFIKKHRYFIFLTIFFLTLLPFTLFSPAQTDTRAIVTGLSIDKENEQFNLALQLITPQSNLSNNENLQVVEDRGKTLYECVNNLGIKLGKTVGFEHTNIIIIGETLFDEDLMNVLDFFYRNSKITLSTILVHCKGTAKDLLETSAELNNNSSSSLQNNLGYNSTIIETTNTTTLGTFFNEYYSFSGVSLIPVIEPPEKGKEQESGNSQSKQNGESSGESSSSGQSGQSGNKVEPLVINNGEGAVYRKGKFIEIISRDLTNGFGWTRLHTTDGLILVENVTDNKYFSGSTVSIDVEHSKTKIKPRIENDKLILNVNLKLYCIVSEISQNEQKSKVIMESSETYLTDELKQKTIEKVKNLVNDSLNYSKEKNVDILGFYDIYYKKNNKEFRKYLSKFGQEYLQNCEIDLQVQVYPFT